MNADDVRRMVADSVALKQRFFDEKAPLLVDLGQRIAVRLLAGGRLLAFGNGGSAADAQHFAAELVVRLRHERRALSAIALTTDPSIVTAAGERLRLRLDLPPAGGSARPAGRRGARHQHLGPLAERGRGAARRARARPAHGRA